MKNFDEMWKCLFGDKTSDEVMIMLQKGEFKFSDDIEIADKQMKAWAKLFGAYLNPIEVAQIIHEWYPTDS